MTLQSGSGRGSVDEQEERIDGVLEPVQLSSNTSVPHKWGRRRLILSGPLPSPPPCTVEQEHPLSVFKLACVPVPAAFSRKIQDSRLEEDLWQIEATLVKYFLGVNCKEHLRTN